MKVGDYVRIKNEVGWCCIGQIHNINEFREPSMKVCVDIQANDLVFIGEDIIVKSSPNIIDLIEVGDYVNGSVVVSIYEVSETQLRRELLCMGDGGFEGEIMVYNEGIKSIVTKEQFESMEYKI